MLKISIVLILMLLPYDVLKAENGISLGSGLGVRHIIPYKVSVQKKFDKVLCSKPLWAMAGYWEFSFYALRGRRGLTIQNNRLKAAAFTPVFRFEKKERIFFMYPYLDVGVGLAWLSKKEICGRELGLHFQFEDRIGLGFRFGHYRQFDISYKFIHFSNAFLGPKNNGIDLHTIVLGYWF